MVIEFKTNNRYKKLCIIFQSKRLVFIFYENIVTGTKHKAHFMTSLPAILVEFLG